MSDRVQPGTPRTKRENSPNHRRETLGVEGRTSRTSHRDCRSPTKPIVVPPFVETHPLATYTTYTTDTAPLTPANLSVAYPRVPVIPPVSGVSGVSGRQASDFLHRL